MKKKFLMIMLAVCLIIPCMFMLSACDDGDKDETIRYSVTTPAETGTGYRLTYNVIANGNNATEQINADSEVMVYVSLYEGYLLGTLQINVNGSPLQIVSVDELSSDWETRLNSHLVNRSISYKFTVTADTQITVTGSTKTATLKASVILSPANDYSVKSIIGGTETELTMANSQADNNGNYYVEIEVDFKEDFYLEYTLNNKYAIITEIENANEHRMIHFFDYNNGDVQILCDNSGNALNYSSTGAVYKAKFNLTRGTVSASDRVYIGEPNIAIKQVEVKLPTSCGAYTLHVPACINDTYGKCLEMAEDLTFGVKINGDSTFYDATTNPSGTVKVYFKPKNGTPILCTATGNTVPYFGGPSPVEFPEFRVGAPITQDCEIYVTNVLGYYDSPIYLKITVDNPENTRYMIGSITEQDQNRYETEIQPAYVTKDANNYDVYYYLYSTFYSSIYPVDLKLFVMDNNPAYNYFGSSYKINDGIELPIPGENFTNGSSYTRRCIDLPTDADSVVTLINSQRPQTYTFEFPSNMVSAYNIQVWNNGQYEALPVSKQITVTHGDYVRIKLTGANLSDLINKAKVSTEHDSYYDAFLAVNDQTGLEIENTNGTYELVFRNITNNLMLNINVD